MSMLSFDHICDPASMFQDTISLSEFILGPLEDDTSNDSIQTMLKTNQDIKQENDQDHGEYQVSVSDGYQGGLSSIYSPCSYTYQQMEPVSPASCSSGCSSSSPVPHGYQLPPTLAYNNEQTRDLNVRKTAGQDQLSLLGYRSRRRINDDELSLEEREKRRVRRERNKMAALRCRTRRRERIEVLEKETNDLENQNHAVENEIMCLRKQLNQLQEMLRGHECNKNLE